MVILYHGYPVIIIQKYLPFIIREWLCCCLYVNYIVLKHFDRPLHIWVLDSTCVQNFRPVALTVFEIQGLKLNNNNNTRSRIGEMDFLPLSPMLVVQF